LTPEAAQDHDFLVGLEIALVKAFGWDLHAIDETDIESLLLFVFQLNGRAGPTGTYCDQVDWL
jgi:hypothetical protein